MPDAPKTRSKLTDDDFLNIVRSERQQSVGFEHDNVLLTEREQALNYFKGQMDDMPSLPNRSSAVSTDIADAIETVLPDLIDIFVGGDDVAMFKAMSQQDEQAAEQETEYVNQVVYQENDGFLILYSMFKDALQSKTGVVKFWWEKKPIKPEYFEGKSIIELALLGSDGTVEDFEQDGQDETGQPTFSLTLTNEDPGGEVKIMPVPPEDFTVARDTVSLADTTYCAFRTRPRAQDLIAQGIDASIVEDLPPYGQTSDDQVQLARDTAGEHSDQHNVVGPWNLRQVEVIEHFVRVDADEDGTPELWRILTGGNETMLIEKEQIDRLPFAAITPFIVTHRFYGESIADRLIQIQRIKTALLRMWLDSGYFALNQRHEVSAQGSTEFTISDLLRNEPGLPVRVKSAGTVTPIPSPGLGFDVSAAMEYVSTMSEQRTGVVRNAQGLNPDTLHDTAGGMEKLMTAAQKRVRMIARIFAETGVKDMFLGVHALLRKHKHLTTAKVGGQWTPVDCSEWAERTKMTVSIGRSEAEEAMALQGVLAVQKEIIGLQGGAQGPLVTLENVYAAATRATEKAGEKDADRYFTDPSTQQPQPPQPNPEAIKAQADAQQDQAELQAKTQIEQAKLAQQDKEHQDRIALEYAEAHDKDQREVAKLQMEHERELEKIASAERIAMLESETKRADVDARLQLEQQKLQTSIEIALIQAQGQETGTQVRAQAEAARMSVDIELQEHQHAHEAEQAQEDRKAQVAAAKAAPKPVAGKPA